MLSKYLILASGISLASAARQSLCSSENTGSDYTPGKTSLRQFSHLSSSHGVSIRRSPTRPKQTNFEAVTNIYQSIGSCALNCGDDYTFAILQDAECWCSNTAPKATSDVSECSTPCPGYPQDMCGNKDEKLFSYISSGGASNTTAGASLQSASAGSSSAQAASTPAFGGGGSWNGTSGGNSTGGAGSSGAAGGNSSAATKGSGPDSAAGKNAHLSFAVSALVVGAGIAFML